MIMLITMYQAKELKCLMFGLACDKDSFEKYLEKNKNPYSVAHYIFETEFIMQLEKNYNIDHNYIYQENNKNLKNARIKKRNNNITNLTKTSWINYYNLPILKYITIFISTFVRILKYSKKNKDFFILSTINYLPVAMATIIASKMINKKNVIIFTDCSNSNAYDYSEQMFIKSLFVRILRKIVYLCENQYDGYILFSECMGELVNKSNKPSCVMEGFINERMLNLSKEKKFDDFIILYGGSLLKNLGLENLIEAVKEILDVQLWIVGDGSIKSQLMDLASGYDNIKFCGFVPREQLFEMEKKASLLVNVRDPRLPYTRYSFPSKTFEYLLSGTPFLSTKLACYSNEYNQHIYFINDNQVETIKTEIINIKNLSQREREKFGEDATNFVLNEKNAGTQCKKVIEFLNSEVLNVFK